MAASYCGRSEVWNIGWKRARRKDLQIVLALGFTHLSGRRVRQHATMQFSIGVSFGIALPCRRRAIVLIGSFRNYKFACALKLALLFFLVCCLEQCVRVSYAKKHFLLCNAIFVIIGSAERRGRSSIGWNWILREKQWAQENSPGKAGWWQWSGRWCTCSSAHTHMHAHVQTLVCTQRVVFTAHKCSF